MNVNRISDLFPFSHFLHPAGSILQNFLQWWYLILLSIMRIQVESAPEFHNDFWLKNYFYFLSKISLQVYSS